MRSCGYFVFHFLDLKKSGFMISFVLDYAEVIKIVTYFQMNIYIYIMLECERPKFRKFVQTNKSSDLIIFGISLYFEFKGPKILRQNEV